MANTATGKLHTSGKTAHSLFEVPLELHSQKPVKLGVRDRDFSHT